MDIKTEDYLALDNLKSTLQISLIKCSMIADYVNDALESGTTTDLIPYFLTISEMSSAIVSAINTLTQTCMNLEDNTI